MFFVKKNVRISVNICDNCHPAVVQLKTIAIQTEESQGVNTLTDERHATITQADETDIIPQAYETDLITQADETDILTQANETDINTQADETDIITQADENDIITHADETDTNSSEENPTVTVMPVSPVSPHALELTPGAGAILPPRFTSPSDRPPLSASFYNGRISPESLHWTKVGLLSPSGRAWVDEKPNTPCPAFRTTGFSYSCNQCEEQIFESLVDYMRHASSHTIRRDGACSKRRLSSFVEDIPSPPKRLHM